LINRNELVHFAHSFLQVQDCIYLWLYSGLLHHLWLPRPLCYWLLPGNRYSVWFFKTTICTFSTWLVSGDWNFFSWNKGGYLSTTWTQVKTLCLFCCLHLAQELVNFMLLNCLGSGTVILDIELLQQNLPCSVSRGLIGPFLFLCLLSSAKDYGCWHD
jgi:hypothetical protein